MSADHSITAGMSGQASCIVDAARTAVALRSGDLPVFATPMLVALMEEAACAAIAAALPDTMTSVGTRIDVRHRAPSPIGATITAHAEVVDVSGARITFEVSAVHRLGDDVRDVGTGTHVRAVVDRAGFLPTR